ncbi:MAG: hypothetical protein PHO26_04765 [Dehalococcoidia bacterium]|nr:hypothetical protein [Dehalococcoidia bacterium]MDD5494239.1 hypothetical protein [Dehalococcoidia bacterium]
MLKKLALAGIATLFLILNTGCVSQTDYNALVQERDGLKEQVTTLQNELNALKTNDEGVRSIANRLEKEINALIVLNNLWSELFTLVSSATSASALSTWGGKLIADFGKAVNDVGDSKLSQLWSEMLQASASRDIEGTGSKIGAVFALLTKMTSEDMAALKANLR